MVFLKQFFTFINFRKTVRDLGYWVGATIFFAMVSYSSWQQHLLSDTRELKAKDAEIDRLTKANTRKDERYERLSDKYINYLETSKRESDSLKDDFSRFKNEIRK